MPEVTIEQWAVIRIEGAGHIEVVAHDRENAMLRYCWHRVSKDASFDFKAWWRENAKKKPKGHMKELMSVMGIKDPEAQPILDDKGNVMPDSDLRDNENVPLGQDIRDYFAKEVLPHVPDAWIDETKRDEKDKEVGIVGYEINFNRFFYQYVPPRKLVDIDADLKAVEAEIAALLGEVTE